MKSLTNDQYYALAKLEKWYDKYGHQVIDISGVVGTGVWDVVQLFINREEFDPREIMYLSYDQKQVIEMAAKRYHVYYLPRVVYKYDKITDIDSLPVVNPKSTEVKYCWKKSIRKKIDPKYKLMVVFDSVLLNEQTLHDLMSFGLPIILMRDPMLTPAIDSCTYMREPNIIMREIHPDYARNPIIYFAHKILMHEPLKAGNYDIVSIVPKKQMNLYNLKSADMTITMSNSVMDGINVIYRDRVLKHPSPTNIVGERLIVLSDDLYSQKIVNHDEKRIKVYLPRGTVGTISKIYKHSPTTRYVPFEFKPEFYYESFTDLSLDRTNLCGKELPSRQETPDEIVLCDYAYALSVPYARISHWDKVTLITENVDQVDDILLTRLLYTGITRARQSLTMVI